MKRLALIAGLVALAAACSKNEPASPQPAPAKKAHVKEGQTAEAIREASDPAKLPPPGTAPPALTVDKELPMWNAAIKTLRGQDTSLAEHKGKALLLVNVASECGLTHQYSHLEALQKKYAAKGFTVIGFPCNQFGEQEPGTAKEIEEFCSTTYGVTFPMMEKIEVNGAARHEIYQTLTPLADASGHTGDIRWNFEKFVVSADGTKITRFNPKTAPNDPTVIAAIENALPR